MIILKGITCTGHSGFLVELPGINLIFDYFTDRFGIITPNVFKNKQTCVFVSHSHNDHFNKRIFEWNALGEVAYVLERGCPAPNGVTAVYMEEGGEAELFNGLVKIKAFGSTDEGVSFLVRAPDKTIFHAGDLNCWYWADESAPEELAADEQSYIDIIKRIAGHSIDIAFIPEDPRLKEHAGRGIKLFQEIVNPGRIIPMHFPGNDGKKY